MQRANSIFVIVLLVTLPLVLLVQANARPACDGICCVRHSMHGPLKAAAEGMSCHRGAAGHMFECGMHSNQRTQNATLAPLPPTMLSSSATLPEPVTARDTRTSKTEQVLSGFQSLPFEPPRL